MSAQPKFPPPRRVHARGLLQRSCERLLGVRRASAGRVAGGASSTLLQGSVALWPPRRSQDCRRVRRSVRVLRYNHACAHEQALSRLHPNSEHQQADCREPALGPEALRRGPRHVHRLLHRRARGDARAGAPGALTLFAAQSLSTCCRQRRTSCARRATRRPWGRSTCWRRWRRARARVARPLQRPAESLPLFQSLGFSAYSPEVTAALESWKAEDKALGARKAKLKGKDTGMTPEEAAAAQAQLFAAARASCYGEQPAGAGPAAP